MLRWRGEEGRVKMGFKKKAKGAWGESVACDYLEKRGYSIVDRNWRAGHCELDIVARRGDAAHVVEVKTRRDSVFNDVSELVRPRQQRAILEASDAYARSHEWVAGVQVDLLVVVFEGRGGSPRVEYLPDAIKPNF